MSAFNPNSVKKYFKDQIPPDLNKLRENGEKFTDNYFLPNRNSLQSKNEDGTFVDEVNGPEQLQFMEDDDPGSSTRIVWKRATEVKSEWSVFEDKIEFDDINQGSLGDCYFLSSISALSEFPYLIKEKFRTIKFNEEGYYEMVFFIDGEWQVVFVDDNFPWEPKDKGHWAYASPNGNELWAMLLEKAWAKVNGGYSNIIAGLVSEALIALTGFPTVSVDHSMDPMDIFNIIEKADNAGTIMTCGSKAEEQIEKKGLVLGHAYTLIGAKSHKEKEIYLLKLRNPWGSGEWKGAWSDTDKKRWTPELKKYFGYEDKDDGIFYMSIDGYLKYFNDTYICYILYGAIIKTYFFENEYYLQYPAVFNIKIKENSKTSVSSVFKNYRFNRDLHNVVHPFAMALFKYDSERKVEKYYAKFCLDDDVSLVEDLEPGNYVLWAYCSQKDVKNDPKNFYALIVSSMKEFEIEFVGLDKQFNLISYLLVENYKRVGKKNIDASKEYFIGSDQVPAKNGLSNLIFINKSDKFMTTQISVDPSKTQNNRFLPPYDDKKNFAITIPPHRSSAIVALKTAKRSKFGVSQKIMLQQKNEEVPPENKFEDLLKLDISNNNDSEALSGLRHDTKKFIAKEKAEQIPSFNDTYLAGQSIATFSALIQSKIDQKEVIKNEYPDDFEYLNTNYPPEEDESEQWDKLNIPGLGTYAGQVDPMTNKFHGRGMFFWEKGDFKYIGFYKDGKQDIKGTLFEGSRKMYEGEYSEGKRNGTGTFWLNENEYYEGEFVEDKMEGKGKYHFENGNVWDGEFHDNMKHGVGAMTYKDSFVPYIVQFENDLFIAKTPLITKKKKNIFGSLFNKSEAPEVTEEPAKEEEEENNDFNILGNIGNAAKKEDDTNKVDFRALLNMKAKNDVEVEEMENEVELTEEEKRHQEHLEFLAKIRTEGSETDKFMIKEISDVKKEEGFIDNFKEIDYDEEKGEKYIGNVNEDSKRQGRGGYFDGENYYFGPFEDDKPNGEFKIFNAKKELTFKGVLDSEWKKVAGKILYPNGDYYKGNIENDLPNGHGSMYYLKGSSWTGVFKDGKEFGEGKYWKKNGVLTEIRTGKEKSGNDAIREDYNRNNSQTFIGYAIKKHPGIIEHILRYKPARFISDEVEWVEKELDDGSYYIGEQTLNLDINGRGCFIYPDDAENKYYVGYVKKGKYSHEGSFYSKDWKLKFKGEFSKGLKDGFGCEFFEDGTKFYGQFVDGKRNGNGVFYYADGSRIEGLYVDGENHDMATIISADLNRKQEITYDHGNIVQQDDFIRCDKSRFKLAQKMDLYKLSLKYRDEVDLINDFAKIDDYLVLTMGTSMNSDGFYLGEMNYVGFRHGRGVQKKQYTDSFYVGYFYNNLREGQGKIYTDKDHLYYEGNFAFDEPFGKGKYYLKDGSTVEGSFNEVGEGMGVNTFPDGKKWYGPFYAHKMNGVGELYDENGNPLGFKKYILGNEQ